PARVLASKHANGSRPPQTPVAGLNMTEDLAPPTAEPQQDQRVLRQTVRLAINGRQYVSELDTRVTLLDALREYLGLPGSKKGCDQGQCGACTVHINGRRVLSCLSLAVAHQKDVITTIEGL